MRIHPRSTKLRSALLMAAVLLAGCDGAQQPTSTVVATISPTTAPIATAPPPTQAPAQPAQSNQVIAPTATVAPAFPSYKGILHGVTPQGFFFLGDPNAPVTLTDYSDFL